MGEKLERLDKLIAGQGMLSRKDVHKIVAKGQVCLNGTIVRDPGVKVNLQQDTVTVSGKQLQLSEFVYIMLNKPRGVVCATRDGISQTVLELIPPALRRRGLFPAGRLDKDTEGFVLLTDDGALAHRMLSPKSHVPKTYIAYLDKPCDAQAVKAFARGILLPPERAGEGHVQCLPAKLSIESADARIAHVVLCQGIYHQVKRMFAACGLTVESLRRVRIGALDLDAALALGQCRALDMYETSLLLRDEDNDVQDQVTLY